MGKKVMILLVFLGFGFTSGCTTASSMQTIDQISVEGVKGLPGDSGIAFRYEDHDYYFTSKFVTDGKLNCNLFTGVKDDQIYSTLFDLEPLNGIYEQSDLTLDQKKKSALQKISELSMDRRICPRHIKVYNNSGSGGLGGITSLESLILFIPIVVIIEGVSQLHLPSSGSPSNDANKAISTIRVGQSFEEVQSRLKKYFSLLPFNREGVEYFFVNHETKSEVTRELHVSRNIYFFENRILSVIVKR